MLRDLRAGLEGELGDRLRSLLEPREVAATARRIDRLLAEACSPIRILGGRRCPGHRSERTGSGLVVGRALLAEEGELVGVAGPAFAAGVDG